ncbi:ras-related protein Rab-35 isoform 2-T3 [Megaptera novaeangliae]|uniref:ras-related protein Rab-35 isoform X3 n=1 Tax=Eubalaena glacialis TaxID=27606 RepID=UPI002A5A974F|nr:ras-related protein Rab-35 isoform X3 [Eubalaena glacialis]
MPRSFPCPTCPPAWMSLEWQERRCPPAPRGVRTDLGRLHKWYYRGTHGVIVVYDVTSAESFVNVKRWLHEINQNCDDVCRILVGNKNDDPERKVVETEDAYKFAGQMGIQLFETSAKENVNVEEMFNCITELVLRAKKDNLAKQQQQQQNDVVKLTKNSKRKKRCC